MRQPCIHHQAAAVLHQQMCDMTELRRLARRFAEQPGIGIGGRGVRRIAPLLAMKVALAMAAGRGRLTAAVFRAETLHAGPGFDQRAIDREMLRRQQWHNRGQEAARDVGLQQTVAILGEHGHIPDRRIHG